MSNIKLTVTFNNISNYRGQLNSSIIDRFKPKEQDKARAIEVFIKYGFEVTTQSEMTFTVQGGREGFEALFGTKLTKFEMPNTESASEASYWYPAEGVEWNDNHELKGIIDEAYIQLPYDYALNSEFSFPEVNYHHLRAPGDISRAINAHKVHEQGITGKNVKVLMMDSGFFFDHPYFQGKGYNHSVMLGSGAEEEKVDDHGHGTAMAANLLSVAPGVEFVGMKLVNKKHPDFNTRISEAFEQALKEEPDIISLSLVYNMKNNIGHRHFCELPNGAVNLECLVSQAIRKGITVVAAAGNGHVGFPAMMPEVLAVGGVYKGSDGGLSASDYTSAFESKIYPGRHVPDLCGLSGKVNNGDDPDLDQIKGGLMMVPVQPGSILDKKVADNTKGMDGIAVTGGSSSATAQVAGVCALMLERNPNLKTKDIKRMLMASSINVIRGKANSDSNQEQVLQATSAQPDLAVGHGLVDAFQAIREVDLSSGK